MRFDQLMDCLECNPVIAAIGSDALDSALGSPVQLIFHLGADLMNISDVISQVHKAGKHIFIHLDLAEGIGKDRAGVRYLAQCGADVLFLLRHS